MLKNKTMKHIKATLMAIFLSGIGLTTITAQTSVGASGGNATGSGGTASYSLGQIAYTSISGSNGSSNQGVQQPFEFYTSDVENLQFINLSMTVFPNPTASFVKLKINTLFSKNLKFQLLDVNGKLLLNQNITLTESTVPMENYPSSIYFLNVTDGIKPIKSFKIIKNN